MGVSRRRLGGRDGRVSQRRVAVSLVHVDQRVRMLVVLRTVTAHPLGGVVDAGGGAARQRVRAEAARGVGRVPLGVGQLLVVGLHGRRHHVEHDDGRPHGLTEHVLGSGNQNTVQLNTICCTDQLHPSISTLTFGSVWPAKTYSQPKEKLV